MSGKIDYRNKLILAPMVRIGTLPARLLSLKYGADLVYCEEIIDYKLLRCKRVENKKLGTVDMIWSDGTVVFRTCPLERSKVVLQLGTADAQRALKVAKMLEHDVAAVDVNMGCPKEFSIKGGMGAALLSQPEKIKEILTTLVNGLSIPVTCKIRILPELEDTLALVKMIEKTGVSAIAIHGRLRDERPRHKNHDDIIKAIASQASLPIIANGGSGVIKSYDDIAAFRESTGCSSVMIARAAQWNFSVFRKEGMLPINQVIKDYLEYAIEYEGIWVNVKYAVQQMLHDVLESPPGKALTASATLRDICAIWGMDKQLKSSEEAHLLKVPRMQHDFLGSGEYGDEKKRKLDDGSVMVERAVHFIRKDYSNTVTPKNLLHNLALEKEIDLPAYDTVFKSEEKLYYSVLTFDNNKYTSTLGEKAKRFAEQAAASICLRSLGLSDGRIQTDKNQITNSGTGQNSIHDEQSKEKSGNSAKHKMEYIVEKNSEHTNTLNDSKTSVDELCGDNHRYINKDTPSNQLT